MVPDSHHHSQYPQPGQPATQCWDVPCWPSTTGCQGPEQKSSVVLPNSSETLVQFRKAFGIMQELFDHRDFENLTRQIIRCAAKFDMPGGMPIPQFLDLGCAPGGFSACLFQVLGPNSVGFGVSLPPQLGGFPLLLGSNRFYVQLEDMLKLESRDLLCSDNSIDFCVGDAQYLSTILRRQNVKVDYRGVQVRSKGLGIWALTVKQCLLAFSKLRHGGCYVFRFSWRGDDTDVHPNGEQVHPELLAKYLKEDAWYKALTHWLLSILKSLFTTLKPFKSEYVHQADVTFYMVCSSFDRTKYEDFDWAAKLQHAFHQLSHCEDEAALVAGITDGISDETKAEIDELLELVARMRAIGIQSRKIQNLKSSSAKCNQMPERGTPIGGASAGNSKVDNKNIPPAAEKLPSDANTTVEESGTSASQSTVASDTEAHRPLRTSTSNGLAVAAKNGSNNWKLPKRQRNMPAERRTKASKSFGMKPSIGTRWTPIPQASSQPSPQASQLNTVETEMIYKQQTNMHTFDSPVNEQHPGLHGQQLPQLPFFSLQPPIMPPMTSQYNPLFAPSFTPPLEATGFVPCAIPQLMPEHLIYDQIQQQPPVVPNPLWGPQCPTDSVHSNTCAVLQPGAAVSAASSTIGSNVVSTVVTQSPTTLLQSTAEPVPDSSSPSPASAETRTAQSLEKHNIEIPKCLAARGMTNNGEDIPPPWKPLEPQKAQKNIAITRTTPLVRMHADEDVEPEQNVDESESLMFSDEDNYSGRHKVYLHKRRSGRTVRERRQHRHKRNSALVAQSLEEQSDTLCARFFMLLMSPFSWLAILLLVVRLFR